MKGRELTIADISGIDLDRWEDLAARAAEPNPFLEPTCLMPAARHQTYGHELQLVVAEEDGRMYACFPVRSVRAWNRFRYPLTTSQARRMTYLGTPLVDATRSTEAVGALFQTLLSQRRAREGRVLALQWVGDGGPVAEAVREAVRHLGLHSYEYESFERGVVNRRADPADYDRIPNKNDRHNRRRCFRRATETLGEGPHLVAPSDIGAAVERFITLEGAGYKGRQGIAMTTETGEPEYFREMCAGFTAQGRLHVLALEAAGQTLAMEILVRGGQGLFLFMVSFDEDFAHFGPGLELHLQGMRHLHETTDAAWIDTCTFNQNHILLRLYPDRRQITTWFINLGGPQDRVAIASFLAVDRLHQRVHEFRHRHDSEFPHTDPPPPPLAGVAGETLDR